MELLHACHERVHRTLALWRRLKRHVSAQGADEPARDAANDILRYFDIAAPQHHEDEERHLFPLVLRSTNLSLCDVVHQLQADHLAMMSGWQQARMPLCRLRDGQTTDNHRSVWMEEDIADIDRWAGLYANHIATEEQHLYPAVMALLSADQIQHMGAEMKSRRLSPINSTP